MGTAPVRGSHTVLGCHGSRTVRRIEGRTRVVTHTSQNPAADAFRTARDQLVDCRTDYDRARAEFRWPEIPHFNFGLDWFDVIAASPERRDQDALVIAEADGSVLRRTFAELADRSNRTATWLRAAGVRRGDRIILMLGNQVELWEIMLAGIKLGAVLIPTATQMGPADLQDRVARGRAQWAVAGAADCEKFSAVEGDLTLIHVPGQYTPDASLPAADSPQSGARRILSFPQAYEASPEFAPIGPPQPTRPSCCTSPPGPRACPSWWSTRTPRTPWGI